MGVARAAAGYVAAAAAAAAASFAVPAALGAAAGTSIDRRETVPAPVAEVWESVFDMAAWGDWNPVYSVTIDGPPAPGKELRLRARYADGSHDWTKERITIVEPPTRLCWDYEGVSEWLLSTDRCIELSRVSDKSTIVRNYEVFGGPFAPVIAWLKGSQVADGLERFNIALQRRCTKREPSRMRAA